MASSGRTIKLTGLQERRLVDINELKNFLERCTGEGTVVDLFLSEDSNRIASSYAKVQFSRSDCVDSILRWECPLFGTSKLRFAKSNNDIAKNETNYWHEVTATLRFGCQVSHFEFKVIFEQDNAQIKFGDQTCDIIFSFKSNVYKLQISYKNLSHQIFQLTVLDVNHLLLRLSTAPRIYKKVEVTTSNYSYSRDDQWERATDFTPSFMIGQSSGLLIELPRDHPIPNTKAKGVVIQEIKSLRLVPSKPFSDDKVLVPIVQPPEEHQVPYTILFKVCILVQRGCIPWPNLDSDFFKLVTPYKDNTIKHIEHALEELYSYSLKEKECSYDPVKWLRDKYSSSMSLTELPQVPASLGLVYVCRVKITPSRIYFYGPDKIITNSVLRNYRDDVNNFLKVSFVDEEGSRLHSSDLTVRVGNENIRTQLHHRILSTIRDGIELGKKKFEFLAFSSSQVQKNSLWMFAPTTKLDASDIRSWMGEFRPIRNVAKYAARLGQSFSSSTETLSVVGDDIECIDDIERNKYVFSDGIGKISQDLAQSVGSKCGIEIITPSAFQIRYGGYKGVVAVDPTLESNKLHLRRSMLKYSSNNTNLDVLSWSKYQPCYLNRQIIILLSTLGISDSVFENKQKEAVRELDAILCDPSKALVALDLMSPGENSNDILKEILNCGFKPDKEPFLIMMLRCFRSSMLLDIRMKAKIYIKEGRQMMGCLDETATLEYGQVFVQYSDPVSMQDKAERPEPHCVKGDVIVAKSPCLHPGDVRVLEAVDVPSLHHMVDCVVFPQKGERPHPNECSGSDLDGDLYFVSWDPELIPKAEDPPMDYDPAPTTQLDHDVTIEDLTEYFADYTLNDNVGVIANAHLVFADKEPDKARSDICQELAKLFSVAVDFPKTGVPAKMERRHRINKYPDFMEKADKPQYESHGVLGKLYREVTRIAPVTEEVAKQSYDPGMEFVGFEKYIEQAKQDKTKYDDMLAKLMDSYSITTEGEIFSMSSTTGVGAGVQSLMDEARSWFKKEIESDDDSYAKASAWYYVTYHPDYWGNYNQEVERDHFISFPWCVHDKLVCIKNKTCRGGG